MKQIKNSGLSLALSCVSVIAGLAAPQPANAALLLPKVPLFVSISVTPNIFLQMDDSGSMDWDIMVPTHFTTCRYNNALGCSTMESTGEFYDWTGYTSRGNRLYETFEYVFSSDDDAYSTACRNSQRDVIELCGDRGGNTPWDWRVKSTSLNALYFNPVSNYTPWPTYSNADFGAARSYPVPDLSTGYNDLRNLAGFEYHHWIDDKGFAGSQPDRTDMTEGSNGVVDQWDSHVKVVVNAAGFSCTLNQYNPNWYSLNPTVTSLALSDPLCVEATGGKTSVELAQSVANWYQYYRRRSMVTRAGVSKVITNLPSVRYGFSLINESNIFVEMPPEDTVNYVPHNQNLINTYLETSQKALGTPLRRGLEHVGRYYEGKLSGKPSPINLACQKNFTILFSDGFWNGSSPYYVKSDVDGDNGSINGTKILLADVAKYYYDRDLSSMPDLVPTDKFDSASHQHMVTYSIGFGITGSLNDANKDGHPDEFNPETHTGPWYLGGSTDNQKSVDDLWHAAWNSRGEYISARRPEDLIGQLELVIQNIADRIGGAASGATNGGSISSNSKVFQAKFDAQDWHGSLLAINIDEISGELGTTAWEAGDILDHKPRSWFENTRNVLTYDPVSRNGTPFTWAGLNDSQKALLDINPDTGISDSQGQARLGYVRGSDEHEVGGNLYRDRSHRLGDIVHSDPQYVGWPPFYYTLSGYQAFAQANVNRPGMIYVGGNDGMLHGFRESDGEELIAYVPNKVIGKLNRLTYTYYDHDFYVNGSPIYGDVTLNGTWRSVLIGGLREGGQGVYALDITDPENFSTSDVLWEFTDEDDADLGNVFSDVQIRKMANGKWAAVFTSGYNNTNEDGFVSPSGDQYVYVLYIEDGLDGWSAGDYRKIKIDGADGLSTPSVADVDGDYLSDFIYVGDLNGRMWKLDVTSENPSNWAVAFGGEPLFEAINASGARQPITTQPAIMRHPLSISEDVLVLFGTGKYLEVADDKTVGMDVQSVYAIWDRDGYYNKALNQRNNFNQRGFTRNQLEQPALSIDPDSNSRVIHDYEPNKPVWFDAEGQPQSRGWVVDLPVEGERIIRKIVLRDNIAFMVSMIPAEDLCAAGGTGWIMALNASTGASPRFPVFDMNEDNVIDAADVLTVGNPLQEGTPEGPANPVGIEMLSMPNLPAFLYDDRPSDLGDIFPIKANSPRGCPAGAARSFTYTTRTNGSIVMIAAAHQPMACGRQSWFQTD
jgi:type IV pilus assembly protein PilY1